MRLDRNQMTIPFIALTMIVALIPVMGMIDALQAIGVALAILAVALATTAFFVPAVALSRFTRLIHPALIAVLAAPALWMVLQLLPMPARSLDNQIWASAASALNRPLTGAITVDIGATLLSLVQYCMVAATMLVAAAVALDRKHATNLLYLLIAVTTVTAAQLVVIELGLFDRAQADAEELTLITVMGVVLSCAAALNIYDQLPRPSKARRASTPPVAIFAAACVAFLICATALLIRSETGPIVAALFGITAQGAIFAIHRWSPGPWGKAGLAVSVIVILFGAVALVPIRQNVDFAIAWSMQSPIATERMLTDVPFAGTGAGTYEALLPIYRDASSNANQAPTAAAVITIELGRAFFGSLIIAIFCCAWLLFRRSLTRRQDYVFAGAGATMLAMTPLLLFVNGGLLGLGASLLVSIVGGVAFGQSLSSREGFAPLSQTASPHASPMTGAPSALWPRGALSLLALVLIAQATWILGAEAYELGRHRFIREAISANTPDDDIRRAAAFAAVRGDLWTKSVRARIARREADTATKPSFDSSLAGEDLKSALRYAPHRSDAWLMLALLAERDKLAGYDIGALLKMSYYTAPNDMTLLPLRLGAALRAETKALDPELQDMIRRDIGVVVTRQPELRPALVAAYRSASPPQRSIAERLISEVDPDYLRSLRTP
ncbi:conserved membrane hypothetical protein [Hyphomicrobiales bacterium]|nr:conserved membrane hypothetical protein [Hyphomicrobiales bacterium]CAH1699154.1 conserved membrane hypothetical protein [Hyphomicrobiales bacterium]CAI0342940.1 conserved membrane hypothetical protein [Hyphomicrobiales bacterium]